MDDLNLPRTEASCPVGGCPWKYDLTTPRLHPDDNPLFDDRVRMVIPPPAGQHLRPAEIAAGVAAARRPRMALARSIDDAADRLMSAARDQDEAVFAVHLGSHSTSRLAEAFGEGLDAVLALLAEAGQHPPVSIPMPGGPRLVSFWEDDDGGYRCSACRTTRTGAVDMAEHFTRRHVIVSTGVRGLSAGGR